MLHSSWEPVLDQVDEWLRNTMDLVKIREAKFLQSIEAQPSQSAFSQQAQVTDHALSKRLAQPSEVFDRLLAEAETEIAQVEKEIRSWVQQAAPIRKKLAELAGGAIG